MFSEINSDIEKFFQTPTFKLMICQSVGFFKDKNTTKNMDLLVTEGNCSAEILLRYRLQNWLPTDQGIFSFQQVKAAVVFPSQVPDSVLGNTSAVPDIHRSSWRGSLFL